MNDQQKVYKLTSVLLHYPQKEWFTNFPKLKQAIESIKDRTARTSILSFLHYVESTPFEEVCEKYVKTFDFHGVATLNLTYNVFKDSRERGEALIKLRQLFTDSDLQMETDELPDFLPMILEFLAVAGGTYVQRLLKLHINALKKLENDLVACNSPYHFLLKAIHAAALASLQNTKVS